MKANPKRKPTDRMPAPISQPVQYPEHKGTPLRRDQFPSIEQATHVAAILAQGKPPQSDEEADILTSAALRLWRSSRDQINTQTATAIGYWQKMDKNQGGKVEGDQRVVERLTSLGAMHFLERETVAWKDAAELLWREAKAKERDTQLAAIVGAHMAGKGFWIEWTVESFRRRGFHTALTFTSLIQIYDEVMRETEAKERSKRASELGVMSGKARKAKAEGWGKLHA